MSGRGHRAPRRAELSQHFLRGRALAASLVAQTNISSNDLVVEIGPGRGVLTRELAERCHRLVAIELDEQLHTALKESLGDDRRIELVHGDFLRRPLPDTPYKVFGSIPYGRTAEIVRKVVGARVPPDDAYMIVQREAAERFAGSPFAPETLPSLLIKPWWQAEITRRLRRTDFDPPPTVDSVVLWLARRSRPLIEESQGAAYRGFIELAFGRRGNSLRRCLRGLLTPAQIGRLADDLGFDPQSPPSELSFDRWLALFRFFVAEAGTDRVRLPGRRRSVTRRRP